MEQIPQSMQVFQCNKCLHILFHEIRQEINSDELNEMNGQLKKQYSLSSPLQGNVYLKNITFVSLAHFQGDLFCSLCNSNISTIDFLNNELILRQNDNFNVQTFPISLDNEYNQHNKEDIPFLDKIRMEENAQNIDMLSIDKQKQPKSNSQLELINFSKKLKKFIQTEREDYQEINQTIDELEELSYHCIKYTENLVNLQQTKRAQNISKNSKTSNIMKRSASLE